VAIRSRLAEAERFFGGVGVVVVDVVDSCCWTSFFRWVSLVLVFFLVVEVVVVLVVVGFLRAGRETAVLLLVNIGERMAGAEPRLFLIIGFRMESSSPLKGSPGGGGVAGITRGAR